MYVSPLTEDAVDVWVCRVWNFAHIYNNCKCVENRLHDCEQNTSEKKLLSRCARVCGLVYACICSFVKGKWPLSVFSWCVRVCGCAWGPVCVSVGRERSHVFSSKANGAGAIAYTGRNFIKCFVVYFKKGNCRFWLLISPFSFPFHSS